jgi:hypothetical protein
LQQRHILRLQIVSNSELNSVLFREASDSELRSASEPLSPHLPRARRDLHTTYHNSNALVPSPQICLTPNRTAGRSLDQYQIMRREQKPNDCNLSIKPRDREDDMLLTHTSSEGRIHLEIYLKSKEEIKKCRTSADRIGRSLAHDGRN